MAFVFLNRYLDLSEAMEDDADAGPLENADLVDTDIPFDFSMPDTNYIAEDLKDRNRWPACDCAPMHCDLQSFCIVSSESVPF